MTTRIPTNSIGVSDDDTNGQVVLNNFGDKDASAHVKLMKVTLQNMFPSINVATIKLSDCRRVVMFNLDKTTGSVEMRHFAVRAAPTGITRAIKKVCVGVSATQHLTVFTIESAKVYRV